MLAAGWSEAQKRAYVLADNQLALNAGWNPELLRLELGDLKELDFDLGLIGFGDAQLAALLESNPGLTDPDEVPESPTVPIAQMGDVWQLGRHRLVCGDATSAEDVARALGGVSPHLMVTDPPYGVEFDPTWRKGSEKRTYMGGNPDLESVWKEAWQLFPGDVAYIWHAHSKTQNLWLALADLQFELRQPIIWNKMRFIIGRGNYCFNHEACFYGVKQGRDAHWQGARDQSTVWDILHRSSDSNHGAQKPVECMLRPIKNSSCAGDAVYEPFCGSGTTIIAAEMTGRACHALEINPTYCDVTIERWQNFTGEKARRQEAA
jgi:DNA modification methylase